MVLLLRAKNPARPARPFRYILTDVTRGASFHSNTALCTCVARQKKTHRELGAFTTRAGRSVGLHEVDDDGSTRPNPPSNTGVFRTSSAAEPLR